MDDWNRLKKTIQQLLLIFFYIKERKRKYVRIIFQKFELWKTNNSINDSKQRKRRMTLSGIKKLSTLLKYNGDFYCLAFFRTQNKRKWHMKYVKIKIFVEF